MEPISAALSIIPSIFGLFKKDPNVKINEIQARVSHHSIEASKEISKDNNQTLLKIAEINAETQTESLAMLLERSDISEQRWMDLAFDSCLGFGQPGFGLGSGLPLTW